MMMMGRKEDTSSCSVFLGARVVDAAGGGASSSLVALVLAFGALAALADAPFWWLESSWRAVLAELARGAFGLALQVLLAFALLWILGRSQKATEGWRVRKKLLEDPWAAEEEEEEEEQEEEEEEDEKELPRAGPLLDRLLQLPPNMRGEVMAFAGACGVRSCALASKEGQKGLWELPEVWALIQPREEAPSSPGGFPLGLWPPAASAGSPSVAAAPRMEQLLVAAAAPLRDAYRRRHCGLPPSPDEGVSEPQDLEAGLRLARGLTRADAQRAEEVLQVLSKLLARVAAEDEERALGELASGEWNAAQEEEGERTEKLAAKLASQVSQRAGEVFEQEVAQKFLDTYRLHWRDVVLPSMVPEFFLEAREEPEAQEPTTICKPKAQQQQQRNARLGARGEEACASA